MGMEFPDSATINVHKIDGIHSIRWELYSPVDLNSVKSVPAISAQQAIVGSSNGLSVDYFKKLRYLEHKLRSRGHHVYYNADHGGVWVFDLPKPGSTSIQMQIENEEILHITTLFETKKLSSGSLKASDMVNDLGIDTPVTRTPRLAGFARPGPADAEKINTHAFSSNFASSKTPENFDSARSATLSELSQGPFSVATIISNLKNAISMSFVYSMAQSQGSSPIGSCSYIGPPFPVDSTSPRNTLRTDQSKVSVLLNSISIRWYPSGTLTVSVSQTLTPGIQRVSDVLVDGLKTPQLAPTSKVLISPSGRVVQFLRTPEETSNNSPDSAAKSLYGRLDHVAKTKKPIVDYLALHGMDVKEEEKWVQLHNIEAKYRLDQGSGKYNGPGFFLWPAKYCFCKAESLSRGEIPNERDVNEDTENDPLVHAESWFMAKASREAAMEAKRKDDELSAQRLQEAQDAQAEETLSDFVPRPTQYLSTQDASGIYPTPPDGLRSQAVGSSINTESQGLASEFMDREIINGAEGEVLIAGSPFAVPLGHEVTSGGYQDTDGPDLFGELDSGLFAANGLTEADFSFFDEPSVDGEISLHGDLESASMEAANREVGGSRFRSEGGILNQNATKDTSGNAATGNFLPSKEIKVEKGKKNLILAVEFREEHQASDASLRTLISDDFLVDENSLADDPLASLYLRSVDSPCESPLIPAIDSTNHALLPEAARNKSFESILFRQKLMEFDDKYGIQGRFGYELDAIHPSPGLGEHEEYEERRIPRVGLAHDEDVESHDPTIGTSLDQKSDDIEDEASPKESNSPHNEAVFESMENDGTPASRKRKRDLEEPINHPVTPHSDYSISPFLKNESEEIVADLAIDLLATSSSALLDNSPSVWSQALDANVPDFRGNDRAFMQVAQILVDHLILRNEWSSERLRFSEAFNYSSRWEEYNRDQGALQDVTSRLFPLSEQCNLSQYASIEKETSETIASVLRHQQKEKAIPAKSTRQSTSHTHLMKLQAPYTCVRRNQTSIDVLASALHFWEELGLGPFYETKGITAFYIFQTSNNVQRGVEAFSEMMGNTYQSCKLGTHDEASDLSGYSNGLVPVAMKSGEGFDGMEELNRRCERLGTDMAQLKAQNGFTVIYMINPFKDWQAIARLCAAFLKLFESYASSLQVDNPNDLVLQIIPTSFVASATTIALPSPSDYKRLAFEVYDRCIPDVQPGRSRYFCAPSVRLARGMPKTINLKLSPEASAGLLSSDACFHLAYSWDPMQRWLTASWTDNQGTLQWNAPYCLGGEELEDPWPVLLNIIKDIWDTTLEILRQQISPWRIFVVKDSPMHKRELEIWLSICTQPSQPPTTLTFLTLEPNPPLNFATPVISAKPLLSGSNLYTTPNSTPAAATTQSPDPSALVSTPGGGANQLNPATPTTTTLPPDSDPTAKLIDITDETWSLNVPHPLPDPLLPPHICRSLATGYLLKRAGARDEDGLIPAQVDFVHVTGQKPGDAALDEILAMYGGLGTLARLRGITHPVRCALPWHVAAARKANVGVNALMRWSWE